MANNFLSVMSKNVGTSAVSVYTIPAATQTTGIGMTISNTSASVISVDVFITRSAVDYYIVKGANIAVGGALVPLGGEQKLVLNASDIIKVKSSAATSADVILSILNIT